MNKMIKRQQRNKKSSEKEKKIKRRTYILRDLQLFLCKVGILPINSKKKKEKIYETLRYLSAAVVIWLFMVFC